MTVSDDTIQAEGLGNFIKNSDEKGLNVSKKMAKNVLKNPGRAMDIKANIATAAASRNPEAALSTLPELISIYNTGTVFISENLFHFIPSKWNKKQTDYTHLYH